MPRIFISYASVDYDFAKRVKEKLEEANVKCLMASDELRAGEEWKEEIDNMISLSDAVIVVLTPHSYQSVYVTYEWTFALAKSIKVIPVKLKESDIHPRIETLHILDFQNMGNRPWEKLYESCKKKTPSILAIEERKKVWNKIRPILNDAGQDDHPDAISRLIDVVHEYIHSAVPIIRLWGNRGGQSSEARKLFQGIGQEIGRCCVEGGIAISCSTLDLDTLEFWALKGVKKAMSHSKRPFSIYFHYNIADSPYRSGDPEELYKNLPSTVRRIEVKYPHYDTFYKKNINDDIAYDRSDAHDARLGSLLQCDCVILVGGTHSAKHLVQLLTFIRKQRITVRKPILFIPIPWVGGTARKVFQAYTGVIEEMNFASLI